MKKILALLCAAALTLGLFCPLSALAADEEEIPAPEGLFQLDTDSEYGDLSITDVPAVSSGITVYSSEAGVPSYYDPRETGSVTPVENQGSWNTCWALAAMGAAEMNGLSKKLLSEDSNLSERHLIYFMTHQSEDPLGNSSGDYNTDMTYWINAGGNPVFASMTMASWHGAAEEATTNSPYSGLSADDYLDSAYAYADVLHLENSWSLDISDDAGRSTLKEMILEYGGAVLGMYYSSEYLFAGSPSQTEEEETPGLVEEAAAQTTDLFSTVPSQETDVQQSSSTSQEETSAEPAVPEELILSGWDEADASGETETEALLKNDEISAATVSLDSAAEESESQNAVQSGAYDDFTVCYYQDANNNTNHEVTIVGWDDNYPAEIFGLSPSGAVPVGDGAWLCKNTHGDDWAGGDGYFWVSYYDRSVSYYTGGYISNARVTVFDFAGADNYDNNYEYDGAVVLGYVNDSIDGRGVSTTTAGENTRRWYANVFTACANPDGAELLEAVSTYTYYPNVPYTVEIYVNPATADDPASGTLATTQEGTFAYAGFHTVELETPVPLEEGDTYAVVFRVAMASNASVFVPACYTLSSWRSVNDSEAGQSFVSLDGSTWYDCYDLKNSPNVRIKAYTVNVSRDGSDAGKPGETDNTEESETPEISETADGAEVTENPEISEKTDSSESPDISATPESPEEPESPAALPFTDVSQSSWAYDSILAVWNLGYMRGVSDSLFSPDSAATRAQTVTVLYRMAGEPTVSEPSSFRDVAEDAWYAHAVAWAQEIGITDGYDDSTFCPNQAVTRQEFLTMLYRYAARDGLIQDIAQPDLSVLDIFPDADQVSSWALAAEAWSVSTGIQAGVADSSGVTLRPAKGLSRGELAEFLTRFVAIC